MKSTIHLMAALFALAGVGCSDSVGPDADPGRVPGDAIKGSWTGTIAPGSSVEIKGIGGAIRASASQGNDVVVSWVKRGRHDDASAIRIDAVEHADGVTLCAVYPDVPGWGANECVPGFGGDMHVENNDVEVTFSVSLPDGVDFIARNIGGDIEATGITGNAFAYSVAGDIDITTSGLAAGRTMYGSITASLGLPNWDRDLAFTTVTGNVRVEVPANTNAEVWAVSTHGRITSDFQLTKLIAGSMRGTLGNGGRRLRLSAINGDIILRRGPAR